MPFYSPRDPGFWELQPDYLQSVQDVCTPLDVNILHFVLGDPGSDSTPVAAMLRMPPDFVLPRHAHPVARFEVVVHGTLDVGERVLQPGDVMVSEPHEFYGPHIAGPEGCTTVEVFASITGVGNSVQDTPDGQVAVSYRT
jgi:hypothetical protein